MHRHPSGNLLGCEPLPTHLCDLLLAILSLGSLPGNGLLDVLSWRRTPLGHRKSRFPLVSRLTCLLILCLLQFRKTTCEQELDRLCQILPAMLAVCDLDRLRSAFFGCGSRVFAAIAADMGDFRMPFHPSRGGVLLTVRQEVKDLMPLQIHHYRAKGAAPAKREVVHPQVLHLVCRLCGKLHDATQNARTLGLSPQTSTQPRSQASARIQANGFDLLTQSGGQASPWVQKSREPFHKDLAWTLPIRPKEFAHVQDQLHLLASTCQMRNRSARVAVNARRVRLTDWTS